MAYVYKHIRLDTNQVFYVGICKNKKRAFSKHGRSNFWKKIVKKTNYTTEIVYHDISWEDACEKEKELIKYYGRYDLNEGTLTNMTDGGEGTLNKVITEDYIQKLKKPKSEETKRKIGLASKGRNVGRTHSDEVRKKISENCSGKQKGRKLSEETKRKIGLASKGRVSANKGKKMSDEQKKKISETLKNGSAISFWKGKNRSEETKRKISEKLKKK